MDSDGSFSVGEQRIDTGHCTDSNSVNASVPRPAPSLANVPAGASIQLIRALRDLYEDDSIASKRPWLLQPVLSYGARMTESLESMPVTTVDVDQGLVDESHSNMEGTHRQLSASSGTEGYVSVLDPRARAGLPPFELFQPASARHIPRVRVSSRPCSARPPSSAKDSRTTRPKSAILDAGRRKCAQQGFSDADREEERKKRMTILEESRLAKQEAIRSWLQRKDEEHACRRRADLEKASLERERCVREEQHRAEQEVVLQRQRNRRLRSAARARKEKELELCCNASEFIGVDGQIPGGRVSLGLQRQGVLKAALSVYGDVASKSPSAAHKLY